MAKRPVAAGPGGARYASGAARARDLRRGRHVDRALHVLPSRADPGIGDRPHAAGRRRFDDVRDRERVPRRRGDDGATDLAGEADASRRPESRSGCRSPRSAPARMRMVLHVLYLIFNEGYTSSGGAELHRAELSDEAIRLARMTHRLLPDDGEVAGLLALMLLIDARRPARTTAGGELVPLAEQDRTLWDRAADRRGHRDSRRRDGQAARGRVPDPGCDRCGARPRAAGRGHGLDADPRALRLARAADGQPGRDGQPRGCGRDGRRAVGGPRRARLGRRAAGRPLPGRRGPGASAGDDGRYRGSGRALPCRGRAARRAFRSSAISR